MERQKCGWSIEREIKSSEGEIKGSQTEAGETKMRAVEREEEGGKEITGVNRERNEGNVGVERERRRVLSV